MNIDLNAIPADKQAKAEAMIQGIECAMEGVAVVSEVIGTIRPIHSIGNRRRYALRFRFKLAGGGSFSVEAEPGFTVAKVCDLAMDAFGNPYRDDPTTKNLVNEIESRGYIVSKSKDSDFVTMTAKPHDGGQNLQIRSGIFDEDVSEATYSAAYSLAKTVGIAFDDED